MTARQGPVESKNAPHVDVKRFFCCPTTIKSEFFSDGVTKTSKYQYLTINNLRKKQRF